MSQPPPTNPSSQPFLSRAYALTTVSDARALYDEWAATYDADVSDPSHDYVNPTLASAALIKYFQDAEVTREIEILDAGCGTGIVGTAMTTQSQSQTAATQSDPDGKVSMRLNFELDGIDLSPAMLSVAKTLGIYRSLDTADLSQPLSIKDRLYDAVICTGVLTQGHVGPTVIPEFVRVVKANGCVVATVKEEVWDVGGYKAEFERLERTGVVEVVSERREESLRGMGVMMRLVVLRVL